MHTVIAKFMYKLNPKSDIGLDLEGAERLYQETVIRDKSGFERKQKLSSYYYYQPLIDFDYKFNPKSSLMVAAGMQSRYFIDQPKNGPELKNYTIPIFRIGYNQGQPYQYMWNVGAEYSTNTYGQDLYFKYLQASTNFTYYISKSLSVNANFSYGQDTYSKSQLDLSNVWKHDRLDNIYIAGAGVNWDMLQKASTPYLTIKVIYNYLNRASNIDGSVDDYVTGYPGQFISYNTYVNAINVQVLFNPTVLIGPK